MVQGKGGFLGRDLSAYGAALSPMEIRANIIGPLKSSNRTNKMFKVTTRDSQEISGVIRNEDNFSVQLQSTDGAFHFLSRRDILSLEVLPQPVMPADYDKTLSSAELDDLVSYLVRTARGARIKTKTESDDEN